MGLEPTTFTLATCTPTAASARDDKGLGVSPPTPRSANAARVREISGSESSGQEVENGFSAPRPSDGDSPTGTTAEANDPDLAAVVAAWPDLPEPIKAGIVAMVKAAVLGIVQGGAR
jgi:hypothetical protein